LQALCLACGSDPEKGTAKKLGSYLMVTCFQTTCVSSAMFITGDAESCRSNNRGVLQQQQLNSRNYLHTREKEH
jgi:hypothetical protein